MHGDQVEERALLLRIPGVFQQRNGIVVRHLQLQDVADQVVIVLDLRGQGGAVGGRGVVAESCLRLSPEMTGMISRRQNLDVCMAGPRSLVQVILDPSIRYLDGSIDDRKLVLCGDLLLDLGKISFRG